jgi:formimidoylglutamate deiminase
MIDSVRAGASPEGAERISGAALPGMPNLHSHAFQRGMAGMTEIRGPQADSFWTWRAAMYRFLAQLGPEQMEAIAAYAYMRMLEAGYTAVAEFHYLHHDPAGRPYADLGEMAARVIAAAAQTGIGLTLLPVLYAHGGFGGAPPTEGQRRFVNDLKRFLALHARSEQLARLVPNARVGLAFHSLRAVTGEEMRTVRSFHGGPVPVVHIHAAEQEKEVADCLAATGARPIEWLLDNADVDHRWCVVHATHMTPAEAEGLARSRAVAGLCPTTEANLGDGLFDAPRFLAAGGRFGIGSDSNMETDPAAELRLLEYGQRLRDRGRSVLAEGEGGSTGARLYRAAAVDGGFACGRLAGALEESHQADIVVLDTDHPDLAGLAPAQWLDGWIFVAGPRLVRTVIVGGRTVVAEGRHLQQEPITARWRAAVERLREGQ